MAIKNYTTRISASKTIGEIQEILASHGAERIIVDYSDGANPSSVTFNIPGTGFFTLPARVDAVWELFKRQKVSGTYEQARKTAWRNIKDWIEAQIALVETGQVELSEVMLPYLLRNNKTLYEAISPQLLSSGNEETELSE